MQEENQSTRGGSKFGLETKWTYSAGTGNRTQAGLSGPQRGGFVFCLHSRVNVSFLLCDAVFYIDRHVSYIMLCLLCAVFSRCSMAL